MKKRLALELALKLRFDHWLRLNKRSKLHCIRLAQALFIVHCSLFVVNCYAQIPETADKKALTMSSLETLNGQPEVGKMYKVEPQGAMSSDGSEWKGIFKKGKENKVLVLFCGGGGAFDSYSEARGLSVAKKEAFYSDRMELYDKAAISNLNASYCKQSEDNMFKDWTLIFLPYTTGDFHCGDAEHEYTGLDGKQHTMHYHGYQNYTQMMKQVMPFVGVPDALVITGFSAGGFATAILSDDVISYFPYTKNVTSCVDASILILRDSKNVAKNVWNAPAKVCNRVNGSNITLDCLEALHKERPYVKILFGVSTYDETLAGYQTYFESGKRRQADKKTLDKFHSSLKDMVKELQKEIPNVGLYIWNDIVTNKETGATMHTTTFSANLWANHGGHGGFGKWIADAVNGNIKTYGLELLK